MGSSPSIPWRQLLAEANRLLQIGQLSAAEPLLRQVLQARPREADALHALGVICLHTRRPEEAIELLRQALAARPSFVEAHGNLGMALFAANKPEEAAAAFQTALQLQPDHAPILCNYGTLLRATGNLDQAVLQFQNAIALKPHDADAYFNLANTLRDQGRIPEAIDAYRAAINLQPNYGEALHNLAFVLRDEGKLEEAMLEFQRAMSCSPPFSRSLGGKAIVLADLGRLAEALPLFNQHLLQNPSDSITHSTMLFAMQAAPDMAPSTMHSAHAAWDKCHGHAPASPIAHSNDRTPGRRLRIGYISPDFRQHSVAYFFENILAFHDPSRVETFCYSDAAIHDSVAERLQRLAHHWRHTAWLSPERLAAQIRQDEIDILVDLAGHTAGNRLLTFARKPAPVQISYLGYPDTTGLSAMDYRLTDAYADPPGLTDSLHAERLLRLTPSFLCYRPPPDAPPVLPPPASNGNGITFGSFNVLRKLTTNMMDAWASILRAVPRSRLLLKTRGLQSPEVRQRLLSLFARAHIEADRVELLPAVPSVVAHLELYNRVDIALDTFPYHGTTTTCEALWMGVPVISLAGPRHVSRVGVSILNNIGRAEWVAASKDDYVAKAVRLAEDLSQLTAARASMRDRMKTSPLMNAHAFVNELQSAYRACWADWCRLSSTEIETTRAAP
jgi:protein O-GlcNAc transferase